MIFLIEVIFPAIGCLAIQIFMKSPPCAAFFMAGRLQGVYPSSRVGSSRLPLILEPIQIQGSRCLARDIISCHLRHFTAGRVIGIPDSPLSGHMDLFRQIQVVVADLVDPFIVVQLQIAIRIIVITRRLYRTPDVKVTQFRIRIDDIIRHPLGIWAFPFGSGYPLQVLGPSLALGCGSGLSVSIPNALQAVLLAVRFRRLFLWLAF
jgi:hypothetical protein